MEDEKIIELFFSRSERAIAETDIKYGRLCMKVAHGILYSAEDCEECVSTSYLKLWNAVPPKRPESLCGYLCRIVRNTALSVYKKISRLSGELYEELDEAIPYEKSVEDEYDAGRLTRLLNEFLGKTKQKNRDIFIAHYYFNMSVKSIASSFDISESAVLSSLLRTRAKLKQYLIERGEAV